MGLVSHHNFSYIVVTGLTKLPDSAVGPASAWLLCARSAPRSARLSWIFLDLFHPGLAVFNSLRYPDAEFSTVLFLMKHNSCPFNRKNRLMLGRQRTNSHFVIELIEG